jgi:hypothetical protein
VQTSNVIMLDNPAPIQAPYPRVTVAPGFPKAEGKPAVLHGFLTRQGTFRSLRAVRDSDGALFRSIEPFLKQWEFRPATRDGQAIELEILLFVPRLTI